MTTFTPSAFSDLEALSPSADIASYPFDHPDADLVLCSSDGMQFRVSKFILQISSPVFADMFSVPQPHSEREVRQPLVEVTESGATLDALLRMIYPSFTPKLADFDRVVNVLEAAHKYDMGLVTAIVRRKLESRLMKNPIDCIAIYAIACHFKLEPLARSAAREFLRGSITHVFVPQLSLLNGADYFNLLDYHRRVSEAVVAQFTSDYPTPLLDILLDYSHTCPGVEGRNSAYVYQNSTGHLISSSAQLNRWWLDARDVICKDLREAPLSQGIFELSRLSVHLKPKGCLICKNKVLENWDRFRVAAWALIEHELTKVTLELSWKSVDHEG